MQEGRIIPPDKCPMTELSYSLVMKLSYMFIIVIHVHRTSYIDARSSRNQQTRYSKHSRYLGERLTWCPTVPPFCGLKEGIWSAEYLWAPNSFPAQVSAHWKWWNVSPREANNQKENNLIRTERKNNILTQSGNHGPGTYTKPPPLTSVSGRRRSTELLGVTPIGHFEG